MGETGVVRSLVTIFVLFPVFFAQSIELCTTPSNQDGDCRVINTCPSLFALTQKRPIGSQDADYLKRSRCGSGKNLLKVCCPSESQLSNKSTSLVSFSEPRPVDSPLLPSTKVCGIDTEDRVYGGSEAGLAEFSWMVLVEYERGDGKHGFYCGGVLINSRYILTAAHCIKGKDLPKSWKLVSVRLGEYNTENATDCIDNGFFNRCAPAPINVPVEETIAHEQYEAYAFNQYHDVGLLRLARNVSFTAFVKPVCLPKTEFDQSKSFVGEKLTVAGWGRTENGSESPVKLKLDIPVKDNSECFRSYSKSGITLHGAQLCAGGEKGEDSCKGDSGGPLMSQYSNGKGVINWYSIGIVSFGPSPCGTEGWPGVYTKLQLSSGSRLSGAKIKKDQVQELDKCLRDNRFVEIMNTYQGKFVKGSVDTIVACIHLTDRESKYLPLDIAVSPSVATLVLGDGSRFPNIVFQLKSGTFNNTTREIIWKSLSRITLPQPSEELLKRSADQYAKNFPNCVGAIDGKRMHIQALSNSGSLFFNYKKTFSIVLLTQTISLLKYFCDEGQVPWQLH